MTKLDKRSGAVGPPGFTMLEILIALTVAAILVSIAIPGITSTLAHSRASRAAAIIESDLRLAFSLAERQGTPVVIEFDASAMAYSIADRASGKLLQARHFGASSEYPLTALAFSVSPIFVFPKHIAATASGSLPLTVTLSAGGESASVEMSSAGYIKVEGP